MKHLIVIATLLTSTLANAEFWDGNRLYQKLTHTDAAERIQALGYIMGVSDAVTGAIVCPTGNPTAGQMMDMVQLWLRENPSVRHKSADTIVAYVLQGTWPCGGKKGAA
jgi:hypothetical protein